MTADVSAPPTADAALAWAAWHAERERALVTPHGWLTLVGYHLLPARPTALGDVPGEWWADENGAHRRVDGRTESFVLAEDGSTEAGRYLPTGRGRSDDADESEVAVELVRRTGRYAIRLRDPQAPARTRFGGVPTFPYDAAWVVEAPARWYDEPRTVVVGAARPGLVHDAHVVGEVDVEHDGRTTTLAVTAGHGSATLLFSDEAPGVAPWRVLWLGDVQGRPTVVLDLNRVLNLPYAFSDHGTCPAPVPGNHLPFAVTAGERAPGSAS
jgi:uncharacterized protein (DUF1684 family)